MSDNNETPQDCSKFDFSAYPADTLFYDRRSGLEGRDRRGAQGAVPEGGTATPERRKRKDRRRRIDPTTFEKQYTEDEMEFMNAMQQFKMQSGKPFPAHGDILQIAAKLGYRKSFPMEELAEEVPAGQLVEGCLPA